MIGRNATLFCCEDISLIENYDEAINSNEIYDCHHKLELETRTGKPRKKPLFAKDLIEKGKYYHRPAKELIFLPHAVHISIHSKGRPLDKDTKIKISKTLIDKYEAGEIVVWNTGMKLNEFSKNKQGNKNPNYGKHWYTDGKTNISAKKCPKGFHKGFTPNIDKDTEKIRKEKIAKNSTGRHWYNNGKINKFCYDCPDGFVPGFLTPRIYEKKIKDEEQ